MITTNYSLGNLWPEFSRLITGDFTSPEGLSAIFVAALFLLASIFVFWSLIKYFQAKKHLKFYKNLIEGVSAEQLLERQRELVNIAAESKAYGRLWREFDESLVNATEKKRLCNTLDAAHFFNTHTIARGLTENRLLSAVPGFLTAIGVIGTFAGLQLGLGPLGELNPTNATPDDLTAGIFGMIGGASIAFMTSVWGVFISVLFNFFEKSLERSIRSAISEFQNDVDYLYPRITAEQSLSNIEDLTRNSSELLAGLSEKIGNKMQEAMQEASGVISASVTESLNSILGPAIERLVDNAQSGSEKALETLLDRFLQGVGSAGDAQKTMMQEAAREIATASGGMTEGLQNFASNLGNQVNWMTAKNAEVLDQVNGAVSQKMEEQSQRDEERQRQLMAGVGDFMSGLKSQLAGLADQNASTLKAVQGELSGQIEDQQGREIARQKILHDQLKGFQTAQERVTEGINTVLAAQKDQNVELFSGLRALVERFEQLSTSQQQAAVSMQNAATEIKAGSNQMGLLSTNLKAAIDSFGQQLSSAVESVEVTTSVNADSANLFKEVINELNSAGVTISNASNMLNEAAGKAENGLTAVDRHFQELSKSLESHLESVQKQVADLLSDYSERVQDQTVARLNTWNEQTNNYISSMTNAVSTLSGVVDEIDGKVSSRHEGNRS